MTAMRSTPIDVDTALAMASEDQELDSLARFAIRGLIIARREHACIDADHDVIAAIEDARRRTGDGIAFANAVARALGARHSAFSRMR
jgi:hypothetical protein